MGTVDFSFASSPNVSAWHWRFPFERASGWGVAHYGCQSLTGIQAVSTWKTALRGVSEPEGGGVARGGSLAHSVRAPGRRRGHWCGPRTGGWTPAEVRRAFVKEGRPVQVLRPQRGFPVACGSHHRSSESEFGEAAIRIGGLQPRGWWHWKESTK